LLASEVVWPFPFEQLLLLRCHVKFYSSASWLRKEDDPLSPLFVYLLVGVVVSHTLQQLFVVGVQTLSKTSFVRLFLDPFTSLVANALCRWAESTA